MFKKFVLIAIASLLLMGGVAQAQTNYPVRATIEVRDQNGRIVAEVTVGQPLTVFSTGWAARVRIRARWFSDPVELGSHPTDDAGDLRFSFNVPDAPPVPGVHTLRLEGTGANGQFRRVDVALKVNPRVDGAGNDVGRTVNESARSSTLAKTGAFFARTAYVGFALLMMGAALYVGVRKRNVATR